LATPADRRATLVLLPAAALLLAAVLLRAPAERRKLLVLVTFPLLTIAWNLVVGNLADVEENNRFRVEVEGLLVVLGHWGLIEIVCLGLCGQRRRRLTRAQGPPTLS
jgi:hypothetical protein